MRTFVTVRENCLYVEDHYCNMDDYGEEKSFTFSHPIDESESIAIKLEDGTAFSIMKMQSLNDVNHRYWSFYMAVPPLMRCVMELAAKGESDKLWSDSHVRHIWINAEDVIPTKK